MAAYAAARLQPRNPTDPAAIDFDDFGPSTFEIIGFVDMVVPPRVARVVDQPLDRPVQGLGIARRDFRIMVALKSGLDAGPAHPTGFRRITLVTATATDYTWFSARYPWLSEMFSLTMVQGLTPAEVLHRMGAREIATVTGFRQAGRDYDRSTRSIGGEQREQFVAATVDNGWTLALETYGNVTDELTIALSHGTRVVSLLHNAKGLSHFCWAEDGQIRLSFEPLFPTRREGTDPDSLVDVMRQVGFDLREGPDRTFQNFMAAGFALMEYLTGVRFTPAHLESATYLYGGAPIP